MATVKTIRIPMPESSRIHQAVNRVLINTKASEELKKQIRVASHALQCLLVAAEHAREEKPVCLGCGERNELKNNYCWECREFGPPALHPAYHE